jgi:hypothetical protein
MVKGILRSRYFGFLMTYSLLALNKNGEGWDGMRYPVRGGTRTQGCAGERIQYVKLASYNRQSLCLPRIKFKEIEWVVAIVIVLV